MICAIIATIQTVSATSIVSIEPSYVNISSEDDFTVSITVNPYGNEIYGAQYTLYFDDTLLRALSQTRCSFLGGNVIVNNIYNPDGRVDYSECRTGIGEVTDNGTLATIKFEVRRSGSGELRLADVVLSNPSANPVPVQVNNGHVGTTQPQPSTPFVIRGYISYKDGSDCNNPAVNITNLNTSNGWMAETNKSLNYYQIVLSSGANITAGNTLQFNAISPDGSQWKVTEHTVTQTEVGAGGFEYNITLASRLGDINGDGRITSADAAIVLQMAVCGGYNSMADVNYDNSVTSLDALMIVQAATDGIMIDYEVL